MKSIANRCDSARLEAPCMQSARALRSSGDNLLSSSISRQIADFRHISTCPASSSGTLCRKTKSRNCISEKSGALRRLVQYCLHDMSELRWYEGEIHCLGLFLFGVILRPTGFRAQREGQDAKRSGGASCAPPHNSPRSMETSSTRTNSSKACTPCRKSKIRCVAGSEPSKCRRCESKRLECSQDSGASFLQLRQSSAALICWLPCSTGQAHSSQGHATLCQRARNSSRVAASSSRGESA